MAQAFVVAALPVVLIAGFSLLALSQRRYWRTVGHKAPLSRSAVVVVRMLGYALVALGLPIALWHDGPGFGALLWGFMLSLAACAVTLTLSWRAGWLTPLASAIHTAAAIASRRGYSEAR